MTLSQVRERYPYVARRFDTALISVAHVKGDDDVLGECVARLHGEMVWFRGMMVSVQWNGCCCLRAWCASAHKQERKCHVWCIVGCCE